MRPAAMPAFIATSGVSLAVLVRPRMPSVPKYLRVMDGVLIAAPFSIFPDERELMLPFSYRFQYLKAVFQWSGRVRPDVIGPIGLGEQLRRQAGGAGFQGRAFDEFAQEPLARQRYQKRQAVAGLQLRQAAQHDQGVFRIGAQE